MKKQTVSKKEAAKLSNNKLDKIVSDVKTQVPLKILKRKNGKRK